MAANRSSSSLFFVRRPAMSPCASGSNPYHANNAGSSGEDIKTVQFGWPLGMPLVRKLDDGLWEVRCRLQDRIARIIFTTGERRMVLLHGFFKKARKTPPQDFALAKTRLRMLL